MQENRKCSVVSGRLHVVHLSVRDISLDNKLLLGSQFMFLILAVSIAARPPTSTSKAGTITVLCHTEALETSLLGPL